MFSRKQSKGLVWGPGDYLPKMMNYREEIMSQIVPGQFDDAESSDR